MAHVVRQPIAVPDGGTPHPPTTQTVGQPTPPASPIIERSATADAFKELLDDADAGADERVLLAMSAQEGTLLVRLYDIEHRLADKLVLALDSPKLAAALATMLRDVVRVDNALGRRVAEVLKVAADLRSRRILLGRGRQPDGV